MVRVPPSLRRCALEIEGWLELSRPEKALSLTERLLANPGARPAGLHLQVRALVALGQHDEALVAIDELRPFGPDPDWVDLTEAWCLKRTGRVREAANCMRRLVERAHQCAVGHYNLGCYLALLGDKDEAIAELTVACGIEEQFRKLAAAETDLESLRGDPRFEQLVVR